MSVLFWLAVAIVAGLLIHPLLGVALFVAGLGILGANS